MANIFTKLFTRKVNKKYFGSVSSGYGTGLELGRTLTPSRAMSYYNTVAPLFTAINSMSSEVGSLNLVVYNKDLDENVDGHPLLQLLKFPNSDCTQYEFMVQVASFYKLTGNAFIIATGPVHRPALELYAVNPANINLILDTAGELETVQVNISGKLSQEFHREDVDGRYRYFSGSDSEIWHIKTFSPRYGLSDPWGLSDLSSIVLELEQYKESSNHNLSLLKRGARPSGAIKVDEHLTDDQFQRLQSQLERFYSGSQNAGRAMILEGGDFVEMSQSNKDMDFATLKKDITSTIYNSLKIPLPLISGDNSSYNNMEIAKLNFYDNCIIPIASRILEEMSVFLLPRYGISKYDLELTFVSDDVEALEPRRNQELLKLKDSGVLTINELRAKLGYDEIEGGDTLYIPSTMMPIGDQGISEDVYKNLDSIINVKSCNHKK